MFVSPQISVNPIVGSKSVLHTYGSFSPFSGTVNLPFHAVRHVCASGFVIAPVTF